MLYLDHVAVQILSALSAANVRSILLKGASFRTWLFNADEIRWYSDVDLLVNPAEAHAAAEVLEALGYRNVFAGAVHHETSLYATEYRSARVIIDLHSSIVGVTAPPADAWRVLTRETMPITLQGVTVESLGLAARCLHVALNAATSGSGPSKAKDDLGRALARTALDDWRRATDLAEELGAIPSLVVGLRSVPAGQRIVRELGVTADIPPDVALRAAGAPPVAAGLNALLTARGADRLRMLGRELVPTPAGLRYWSPLARRGRLGMGLAYAYRPIYLLVRVPPAVAAVVRVRRNRGRRSTVAR